MSYSVNRATATLRFFSNLDLHFGTPGLKSEFCFMSPATLKQIIHKARQQELDKISGTVKSGFEANRGWFGVINQIQTDLKNSKPIGFVFSGMPVTTADLKDDVVIVTTNQGTKTFEITQETN